MRSEIGPSFACGWKGDEFGQQVRVLGTAPGDRTAGLPGSGAAEGGDEDAEELPVVTTTSPLPTKFQIVSARGKALDLRVGSSSTAGPTTNADVSLARTKVNFLGHQGTDSGYEVAEVIAV